MKNRKTVSSNVWIFQAQPKSYDILIEVPKRQHGDISDRWIVTRYRKEMQIGDVLLLWRSGDDAGIYGTGKICSASYERSAETWVDVKFDPLLKVPILRSALKRHRLLKEIEIIRMPRATNYQVRPAEWRILKKLLGDNQTDPSGELLQTESDKRIFDPRNKRDARERIVATIIQRRGQPEFRSKLLGIYGGKCLISNCDAAEALEAAHICAYRGEHTNHPTNGLLLRSDLHTLFDLYLISIDARKKRVLVAPELRQTCYARLSRHRVRFPENGPSPEALDEHRAEFERRLRLSK